MQCIAAKEAGSRTKANARERGGGRRERERAETERERGKERREEGRTYKVEEG